MAMTHLTRGRRLFGLAMILTTLALATVLARDPAPQSSSVAARTASAPRTPWGDPDLQGTWTSDGDAGVPFERPTEFGEKQTIEGDELADVLEQREVQKQESAPVAGGITGAGPTHWYENWSGRSPRTSMVIAPANGRVPPTTQEARDRAAARDAARKGRGPADSWEDRSLWDRCITRSLPNVMFPTLYNNNVRIIQAPGYVAITHEMVHDTRIVPLDRRGALSPKIRQYMGESRGRWEGNTLVIDVTNFTDRTNYRGSAETLHLVERYTRVGPDAIRYEVTVDDPHTFAAPWTAALNLTPQSEMYEYACHEGNYAMRNILSGARAEEKAAADTRRK
jgi:hypothetical protein